MEPFAGLKLVPEILPLSLRPVRKVPETEFNIPPDRVDPRH